MDPVADSGRRRVLGALAAAAEPRSTRELAEQLGMHRNGVRAHLLRLRDAGLAESRRVVRGPGRPADVWSPTAQGRALLVDDSASAHLARWLATIIAARPEMLDDVEAAGRGIGAALARDAGAREATPALVEAFGALGFAPRVERDGEEGTTIRLCHCPYRDAVRSAGRVVCTLHRGLTDGAVRALDPAARLAGFEPRDPDEASCLVRVVRGPARP